jgi:hypothetical protein
LVDQDVHALLRRAAYEKGASIREVASAALRRELAQQPRQEAAQ